MDSIAQRLKAAATRIEGFHNNCRRKKLSMQLFLLSIPVGSDEFRVAGLLIEYFCSVEDGKFNGFKDGVLLCMRFLSEAYNMEDADAAELTRSLAMAVKNDPRAGSIEQWARDHIR